MIITYKLNDFNLDIEQPVWWDDIQLGEEITLRNYLSFTTTLNNSKEWKKAFKAYFYYGQLNNEVPYKWSQICLQDQVEEHGIAIQIFLGIVKYLKKHQPNESDPITKIYKDLGDSYHELGEIKLAIEYYNKSSQENNNANSPGKYYADQAFKISQELQKLEDKSKYAKLLIDFKENLIRRSLEIEKDTTLRENIENKLTGFIDFEVPQKLTNFQLAFLEKLKTDSDLEIPKIITQEIKSEVRKQFEEYHENPNLELKIIPSQVTYPTEKSNKWSLHFDGTDFEIVSVYFKRWNRIDISLSD